MKIGILCTRCGDRILFVPLRDDGFYRLKCPGGHTIRVCLQNPKFELLLVSAGMAYLDGYYRESVVSMNSAFEEFIRFYIEVIAVRRYFGSKALNEVGEGFWSGHYDQVFKEVRKQINLSERQYGAFVLAYLFEKGSAPPAIKEQKLSTYNRKALQTFRNDIIHNGYIPTSRQAAEFGESIFTFIREILSELQSENTKEALHTFQMKLAVDAQRQEKADATQCSVCMLNIHVAVQDSADSFRNGLERLEDYRKRDYYR